MAVDQIDLKSLLEQDSSTVYTAITPATTSEADLGENHERLKGVRNGNLLVPYPGSTFIIRSIDCGRVVTLLDGQVTLTKNENNGSIYWLCVENNGWIGFRNAASGKFLGHDGHGQLRCSADHHKEWENFCFRASTEGGSYLLMQRWEWLSYVEVAVGRSGVAKLATARKGVSAGIAWEFLEA